MTKELRHFSLYSFAIVALIAVFGLFVNIRNVAYFAFLLFAWLIGLASFAYLVKMSESRPQKFVAASMVAIGLKMFGSLSVLLIYGVLAPKDQILPTVLGFMVAYLAITGYEVYCVLPLLKNNPMPARAKQKITVINVFASQPQKEVLVALLSDEGFDSFLENEHGFEAAMASKDLDLNKINQIISSQNASYTFKEIEDQNWNSLWESQVSPLEVDHRLYVRAEFHPSNKNFPLELIITPKMAFGSGHHQTTYMMTQYILDHDFSSKIVLDAGCGTGILGILAKRKGASKVVCVDIEDWAVDNASENAQINNEEIVVKKGTSLSIDQTFDCILANISLNALLSELHHYSSILVGNGIFFASGFFVSDIETLKAAASKHGFELNEQRNRDNWAAVKFLKTA